jgi:WD40 repeat protein
MATFMPTDPLELLGALFRPIMVDVNVGQYKGVVSMRRALIVSILLLIGALAALAQGEHSPITASNAEQVQLLREFETTSASYGAFFSPDSTLLGSFNQDNTIQVWDIASGEELFTLSDLTDGAWFVVFSPDGKYLASLNEDDVVQVWDVDSRKTLVTFENCEDFSFSPAGALLAVINEADGSAMLWDITSGEAAWILSDPALTDPYDIAFSPDGTRLALAGATPDGSGSIGLWDTATGEPLPLLEGHDQRVLSIAFNPDGTRLASGGNDNTVRLWDLATGGNRRFSKVSKRMSIMSFSARMARNW